MPGRSQVTGPGRSGYMKSISINLACSMAGVLLILAASGSTAAAVMYRFTNDAGEPVYSYTLPPDQARAGYQKIDAETGQVLESVAPQLPPDELAEKLRREREMQACRDELARIYQLYGSEGDIEHALQDALESLETRISQLQANLRQATREQNRLRSQAADAERAGREIAPMLLGNIERSRSQIESLESEIEQRLQEEGRAEARYARELRRFRDGTCPESEALADTGSSS